MEDDVYTVDRIVKSRKRNGIQQYLVKWTGYPDSENTWEDEKNILCKGLIKEYEESRKKSKVDKSKSSSKIVDKEKEEIKEIPEKQISKKVISRVITNDWDDIVDKVISISRNEKDNSFMIELLFKNGERGLLPASQVHTRCPLHLLEYYEDNLIFTEDEVEETK